VKRSLHKSRLIKLFTRARCSQFHTTMDFSNLWKHCYRFTHASFHTVYNYSWLTAISSVTATLHCLPRCL